MRHVLLSALLAGASFQAPAQAAGSLAGVDVVDRETGQVLPLYSHRGEHWVAGKPGNRYSIRIRNRTGGRLLAITSVDGVNIITGETASWDQPGYVYGAGQSHELTGWRKSDAEVAVFEFTAAPASYASRTGRPANIGVIGVALFRERVPVPVSPAVEREERASADAARSAAGQLAQAPREKLGTGHGEREQSLVERTDFERAQESPDEIIRIRYDSRANLVARGVIREPRRRNEPLPDPFPGSPMARYVPDPPDFR